MSAGLTCDVIRTDVTSAVTVTSDVGRWTGYGHVGRYALLLHIDNDTIVITYILIDTKSVLVDTPFPCKLTRQRYSIVYSRVQLVFSRCVVDRTGADRERCSLGSRVEKSQQNIAQAISRTHGAEPGYCDGEMGQNCGGYAAPPLHPTVNSTPGRIRPSGDPEQEAPPTHPAAGPVRGLGGRWRTL